MDNIYKINNLKINDYHHGGSRVFLEDKNLKRYLLCDTFGDIDDDISMKLKSYIHACIRDFLRKLNTCCNTCIHRDLCKHNDGENIDCEQYVEIPNEK